MNGIYAQYAPQIDRLAMENGGMEIVWAAVGPAVRSFIKKHRLKSYSQLTGQAARRKTRATVTVETAAQEYGYRPLPFPGIPQPHFHYGGELYLLTKAQFEEFSKPLVRDFQKRLGSASQVSVDAFKALAKAADLV